MRIRILFEQAQANRFANVSAALDFVRESLDRYLDGLAGYGLPGNVMFDAPGEPSKDPPYLDSYPSLLIAAADYVEGTGDKTWLARRYRGLQTWADKLLAMDHDGNGLFEYLWSPDGKTLLISVRSEPEAVSMIYDVASGTLKAVTLQAFQNSTAWNLLDWQP